MFSDTKKEKTKNPQALGQNIIAEGTQFTGDLSSEGGFRIDGIIDGNLKTNGKIVVGKTGVVKGSIEGIDAYFEGKFSGKLHLKGTLTLKSSAHIEGDVTVGKLAVEPGATFNVNCIMKGTVKDINKSGKQPKQTEKTA